MNLRTEALWVSPTKLRLVAVLKLNYTGVAAACVFPPSAVIFLLCVRGETNSKTLFFRPLYLDCLLMVELRSRTLNSRVLVWASFSMTLFLMFLSF
jgi:hypothetical protein